MILVWRSSASTAVTRSAGAPDREAGGSKELSPGGSSMEASEWPTPQAELAAWEWSA